MIEMVKASVRDARILAATRQIVWIETYRGIYPDSMLDNYCIETYAQLDRQRMESTDHHYYLFMDRGECVGYFSLGPYNYGTYKDFELCLNNLYIRDGYKGLGLGKRAFAVVREHCAQQGIDKFFCGCNVHNTTARAFYSHMGGVVGSISDGHESKADDIVHFEFYTGD